MDTSGMKVLLVDDDEEEYLLTKKRLSKTRIGPLSVTWASTFEAALDELKRSAHDICLLDYQLGDRTGIELLKEMRAREHDLPVILLTGHGSLEVDLTAMELGALDYLDKKDITPTLLERSLRYTVNAHRARAALRKANEDLERRVQERTAELHRSNRELEQFAQMVASDLREPLKILVHRIEVIQSKERSRENERDPRIVRGILDSILHAVRNMELLIQSVLDYAQAGKTSRSTTTVDLSAAFAEARDDLAEALSEVDAEIEVEPLPTVRGDHNLIRGLFRNLLDNAIQFRGKQTPVVRVWCESKGDAWVIGVTDNGVGIDPDRISDLFVMFHRGDPDAEDTGIGIGLAMCRKIAQYHGGRIWVDSEPGRGSTFYVAFPAH
ncbi:MAG: response regulator [Candidatus Hydrogenedentes bacterium]|nr:response regulator [Candidatus Hydrogenedentota bacterium]